MSLYSRRVWTNRIGITLSMLAMSLGLIALLWILWTLFPKGLAEDANFRNADLRDVDFTCAVLGGAILRRADVGNADFAGVELASVTMEFANFSQAKNANIPAYKKNLR